MSKRDVTGHGAGRSLSPPRTRQVLDRLLRERTAVARSDGRVHSLFPVAVDAAEGKAIREWVKREKANRTIEIGLDLHHWTVLQTTQVPPERSFDHYVDF